MAAEAELLIYSKTFSNSFYFYLCSSYLFKKGEKSGILVFQNFRSLLWLIMLMTTVGLHTLWGKATWIQRI